MEQWQPDTELQAMMQWEAGLMFREMMHPVIYTPTRNPTKPFQIEAVLNIGETVTTTEENGQTRYHRMAKLTTFAVYGPFLQGDQFQYRGITWAIEGSPDTDIMNGLQTIEVQSNETHEVGQFRWKA